MYFIVIYKLYIVHVLQLNVLLEYIISFHTYYRLCSVVLSVVFKHHSLVLDYINLSGHV